MLQVCPTNMIHAPADHVWHLVINPLELARWTDTRLLDAPQRDVRAGDRLLFGAGFGHCMKVTFQVREVVASRRLAVDVRLPFGVSNDEVIEITAIDPEACRVTFT